MKIEIWSDVVCPWCYIGKRRIENALAEFGHADEVEVHWRSYELDPGAPTEPTQSTSVMLARKYGQSAEGAKQMQDRVEAVAAEEGLVYRLSETLHLNTVDAHRLIHLAHAEGGNDLQGRVKEALLAAYFTQARNVADHAVLREVAVGCRPRRRARRRGAGVPRVRGRRARRRRAGAGLRRHRRAVLRHRREVRRLRRAADRGLHPGARAGLVGVATALARCCDRRRRRGVRPRRLRRLTQAG